MNAATKHAIAMINKYAPTIHDNAWDQLIGLDTNYGLADGWPREKYINILWRVTHGNIKRTQINEYDMSEIAFHVEDLYNTTIIRRR